ncbi:hypothetical protein DY000_02033002 [Brassica cretica]|uniref:Uncharacterized protein n=1 Tax=Brassica cretica TaxID=69181 RepID=A0ABQ7DNS6_BRACR|nr:hypothetical protein DY000_02033002 [Brassica cretica]
MEEDGEEASRGGGSWTNIRRKRRDEKAEEEAGRSSLPAVESSTRRLRPLD